LSGTVDAVITAGVLIKGDTMHFEYISDAVSKGIMNVGIQTNIPVVFGVLTCLTEEQVKQRSSDDNNHGYDWGKTAVEMALLRSEAIGSMGGVKKPSGMGFGVKIDLDDEPAKREKGPGFF
jgi:6,7-dimethyl-8-ribityllumazine synthase